jgi:hypothetical protein
MKWFCLFVAVLGAVPAALCFPDNGIMVLLCYGGGAVSTAGVLALIDNL